VAEIARELSLLPLEGKKTTGKCGGRKKVGKPGKHHTLEIIQPLREVRGRKVRILRGGLKNIGWGAVTALKKKGSRCAVNGGIRWVGSR